MQNLTAASSELFRRSPDECFESLATLSYDSAPSLIAVSSPGRASACSSLGRAGVAAHGRHRHIHSEPVAIDQRGAQIPDHLCRPAVALRKRGFPSSGRQSLSRDAP